TTAEAEFTEGDAALGARLAVLAHRLRQAAQHDRALSDIVQLADEAKIRVDEAGRILRAYRERLDLDPGELAREHRVRPEALPALADETARRLTELVADSDAGALERAADQARQSFDT